MRTWIGGCVGGELTQTQFPRFRNFVVAGNAYDRTRTADQTTGEIECRERSRKISNWVTTDKKAAKKSDVAGRGVELDRDETNPDWTPAVQSRIMD